MRVDPEVLGIIGEDVLIQHKAVPIRVDGDTLMVAMSYPKDVYARSGLTMSDGYPIRPSSPPREPRSACSGRYRVHANGTPRGEAVGAYSGLLTRARIMLGRPETPWALLIAPLGA